MLATLPLHNQARPKKPGWPNDARKITGSQPVISRAVAAAVPPRHAGSASRRRGRPGRARRGSCTRASRGGDTSQLVPPRALRRIRCIATGCSGPRPGSTRLATSAFFPHSAAYGPARASRRSRRNRPPAGTPGQKLRLGAGPRLGAAGFVATALPVGATLAVSPHIRMHFGTQLSLRSEKCCVPAGPRMALT